MFEKEIENILNAQPIKYYPNKEDAQRVLRERNARLAEQISQLFEQVKRDIFNKTVHAAEHRERFVIAQTRQETAREINDILEGYIQLDIPSRTYEILTTIQQSLIASFGVK